MKKLSFSSDYADAYLKRPNHTFFILSLPVLISMIAEPLTGLVDTAFVARLGTESLAALGVGTVLLSSIFWVFNFLGVGSQTEVGQALGRNEENRASEIGTIAILVGILLGIGIIIFLYWFVAPLVSFMGAENDVHEMASRYVTIRLLGAPAILATTAAFGILRGMQDMHTPLWVAVSVNAFNILLDGLLIFGIGPFPALGITGAALATVISQWLGAVIVLLIVWFKLGKPQRLNIADSIRLFRIGGDMFVRTGLLLFYLVMATRTATRISAEAGAAHQSIRQFWTFTALFLDAYSVTAQSLIAFFTGQGNRIKARNVARTICWWSLITGMVLTFCMLAGQPLFIMLLVPENAVPAFIAPWWIAAFSQPLNSIAFATDGIHWGTGDFAYLRNGMIAATFIGLLGIFLLEYSHAATLENLWLVTAVWIFTRAVAGFIRVWPGIGKSPMAVRP